MNARIALVGTLLVLGLSVGCGGGDDSSSKPDAGGDEAGKGGSGGGGSGGSDSGAMHDIGGKVTGLSGKGLVLQNNGGDDLTITENGDFTFSKQLSRGSDYEVTISKQPSEPTQTCSVSMGSGKVGSSDVTDIAVSCAIGMYKVGGNVSGLTGDGLVLSIKGGEDLTINADGSFSFSSAVNSGDEYAVTIKTQPSGQTCTVKDGSGTVGGSDVSNISVSCLAGLTLKLAASFGQIDASWNDVGADSYELYVYSSANCDIGQIDSCPDGKKLTDVKTPYTITDLTNGKAYYGKLRAVFADDVTVDSNQTGARPHRPAFDNDVMSVAAHSDGTVYLGGAFTRLAIYTGAGVPLDRTTGLASDMPNFSILGGSVYSATPDNNGGFYVGGLFTIPAADIDDIDHTNLVHIKADGELDKGWNPAPDGAVDELAVIGDTVYAAGRFTMIGGQSRAGLAAVDASGNATGWDPNPTPTGITALVASADKLYVGGSFDTIGGQARAKLAALNTDATGTAIASWNPNPDNEITAIMVVDDLVYVAGYFANIGGQPRLDLAAIDSDGNATEWDPHPNDKVLALAYADGLVYAAGGFSMIGNTARNRLAAIYDSKAEASKRGRATDWDPNPNGLIATMVYLHDAIYIGGEFSKVGDTPRNKLAAINTAGMLTDWDPNPDGNIFVLAGAGEIVYAGGEIEGMGGIVRRGLVAFDDKGVPTKWNPNADGEVRAVAVAGDTIYAGGQFTKLGDAARSNIGAVDRDGAATSWNPNADGSVEVLAASDNTIYAGGTFTNIGGQGRNRAAALDMNGSATSFNPNADATVRAFAFDGTTVYVGGEFANIGGAGRNRVAAFDGSGALTSWNPDANGIVRALLANGGKVYVGGDFTMIAGQARNRLAAVDDGGAADGWNPDASDSVTALGFDEAQVYAAGNFSLMGTTSRNHIAAFDGTGALTTWQPNLEGNVASIAFTSSLVHAGGSFRRVDMQFSNKYTRLAKSVPQ